MMAISCHETWYTHPILPAVKSHALGCIQVGPLQLIRLHLKKALKRLARPTWITKGSDQNPTKLDRCQIREKIPPGIRGEVAGVSHKSRGENGYPER